MKFLTPRVRGDLFGGVTAAIIALPLAVAFGVLTFSPLGPEFRSQGALAGLYGAMFTGFFAALFGGTPSQVTGPTGPLTVVMAALFMGGALAGVPPELRVPAAFFTVALAGLFQILLGAARLGTLIKFIPYPVVAGFMNGIAIIIFTSQLLPLLGVANDVTTHSILSGQTPISWWTLLTGLVTIAITMLFPRLTKAVPGALVGLVLGTVIYYLASIPAGETMGPVIGHIPAGWPEPTNLRLFPQLMAHLPTLIGPALVLAMLGSLDSLLTSIVADAATRTQHNSNRELLGQGIGNFVAGCFGGIAGAGATVRTMVNIGAGGRGRLSGMTHSLVLLLVVAVLGPWAGKIPLVVLAGILIVTAVRMVDQWSGALALKLVGTAGQKREIAVNLAVVALVTLITVTVDLMVAVAVGLGVAAALFIGKMRGSVVGAVHYGNAICSRRERTPQESELLEVQGSTTAILELHGSLFFGSADELAAAVRGQRQARRIILDFRRVVEVDSSGARVLQLIQGEAHDSGRVLALCNIVRQGARWAFLEALGILPVIGEEHIFPDLDQALEWAENQILKDAPQGAPGLLKELHEMEVSEGMTAEEIHVVLDHLVRVEVQQGELLFRAGQISDGLYVLLQGTVSAHLQRPDSRPRRLATFGPGSVFGEMSLLERRPRTADILSDTVCALYRLSGESLEHLCREHPSVGTKLLWNLGRELSRRLRRAQRENVVLEGTLL